MYGHGPPPIAIAGYVALIATPAALLAGALVAPQSTGVTTGTIGLHVGLVLASVAVVASERTRVLETFERGNEVEVGTRSGSAIGTGAGLERSDVADALAVLVAAVLTYALSVHAGLGPVLASAVVGLIVGLAVPELDGAPEIGSAAYCGSFVGMASPLVFPSLTAVAAAGLLAGITFVVTTEPFGGFGGKLGTVAFFGCVATVWLSSLGSVAGSDLAFQLQFQVPSQPQFRWATAPAVVPVAIAGAVATAVLRVRLEFGAVVASALVGVVAGVAFPLVLPELGPTLAAVAFCASFAGMSTNERLASHRHVALAGALCGLVFVAVAPAFVGAGGKLGTVAFVSCLAAAGVGQVLEGLDARIRPV